MPQFLQASYDPSNSLSKAIESLGANLFPSPANQLSAAQAAQIRLKAELGEKAGPLAVRAAQGDRAAAAELSGIGVQGDISAANALPWTQYGRVSYLDNQAPGYKADASQAGYAAGHNYDTTPLAAQENNQAQMARQQQQSAAAIEQARIVADIQARNTLDKLREEERIAKAKDDSTIVWGVRKDGTPGLTTHGEQRQLFMGGGGPAIGGAVGPSVGGSPVPAFAQPGVDQGGVPGRPVAPPAQRTPGNLVPTDYVPRADANTVQTTTTASETARAQIEGEMSRLRTQIASTEGIDRNRLTAEMDRLRTQIASTEGIDRNRLLGEMDRLQLSLKNAKDIATGGNVSAEKIAEGNILAEMARLQIQIQSTQGIEKDKLQGELDRLRMQLDETRRTGDLNRQSQDANAANDINAQMARLQAQIGSTQGIERDKLQGELDRLKMQMTETRRTGDLDRASRDSNSALDREATGRISLAEIAEKQRSQIATTKAEGDRLAASLSSAERQELARINAASALEDKRIGATSALEDKRITGTSALEQQRIAANSALEDKRIGGASALEDKRIGGASALETQKSGATSDLEDKRIAAAVEAKRLDREIERNSKLETPIRVYDTQQGNAPVEVPYGVYLQSIQNRENRFVGAESAEEFSKRAGEKYKVDREMVDVVDLATNEHKKISNFELNKPENAGKYRGKLTQQEGIGDAIYNATRADGRTGGGRTPGVVLDALGSKAEVEGRVNDRKEVQDTVVEAAKKANIGHNMKSQLKALGELNDNGQLTTGILTEKFLPIIKAGGQLGIFDPKWTGQLEAFEGATNNLVVTAADNKLGGNFSNTDLDFLRRTKPGIGLSKEGNRLTIEVMKRAADRNIEAHMEMERLRQQNPNISPSDLAIQMHTWVTKQPSAFEGLRTDNQPPPVADRSVTGRTVPPAGARIIRH